MYMYKCQKKYQKISKHTSKIYKIHTKYQAAAGPAPKPGSARTAIHKQSNTSKGAKGSDRGRGRPFGAAQQAGRGADGGRYSGPWGQGDRDVRHRYYKSYRLQRKGVVSLACFFVSFFLIT